MSSNTIPRDNLSVRQNDRIQNLQELCCKAIEVMDKIAYVPIDDDESVVAISVITETLDELGFASDLISRMITEHDSYYRHDYDAVRTFLVIVPRPVITEELIPNTKAYIQLNIKTNTQLNKTMKSKL